jgi:hypothetical protein
LDVEIDPGVGIDEIDLRELAGQRHGPAAVEGAAAVMGERGDR